MGREFHSGGIVKRIKRSRAIDLGTGSGIHAILAASHCSEVIGADVNPRVIAFSRFNAALNGTTNVEFVLSDLLNSIDVTCDLLTANPPYVPDSVAKPGDNFWSGGVNGTDLLRRIITALPSRLEQDGSAHIISLYPNPAGTKIRDHFDRWLGGRLQIGMSSITHGRFPIMRICSPSSLSVATRARGGSGWLASVDPRVETAGGRKLAAEVGFLATTDDARSSPTIRNIPHPVRTATG
jgi:hypothetical protein